MKIKKIIACCVITSTILSCCCLSNTVTAIALSKGLYTINDLPIGTILYDAGSTIGATTGVKFIKVNQSPAVFMTYDDYISHPIPRNSSSALNLDNYYLSGLSSALKANLVQSSRKNPYDYIYDDDEYSVTIDCGWNYKSSYLYLPSLQELTGSVHSTSNFNYTGNQFDYFKTYGNIGNTVWALSSSLIPPYSFDNTPKYYAIRDYFYSTAEGQLLNGEYAYYINYYSFPDSNKGMSYVFNMSKLGGLDSSSAVNYSINAYYFCLDINPNMPVYIGDDGQATLDDGPPTITALTVPSGWAKTKTITFAAADSSGGIQYRITDSAGTELQAWTSSASWTVAELGSFNLYARDKWGNTTAAYGFSVTGIDNLPPNLPIITKS